MASFGRSHKRPLSADDKAIWQRVARTVTPSPHRAQKKDIATPTIQLADKGPFMRVTPAREIQKLETPKALEPSADKRVRRGRIQIDRRIDLHDMTRDQARPALHKLIRSAYAADARCLLVITGKGLRLNGVLRQNFPSWINAQEVRPMIASYAQAHIRHGGTGAWYVFLKRRAAAKE
jgi:DNA-nicking Smr family endonuclease